MQSNKGWRLRWVHRIGYVTTAMMVLGCAFIGLAPRRWWPGYRETGASLLAPITADSRLYDVPLLPDGGHHSLAPTARMLDTLPPLKHLNKDGLRFVAMPSFGVSDYAVALWLPAPDASEAQGLFAAVEKSDTAGVHMGREFTIPATEYRTLMSNLDRLIQTGNRDNDLCLDGTGAAFDRFKDGTVISSLGNCSPMFEELKLVVLKAVRRFAPGDDLPTEDDWHRSY